MTITKKVKAYGIKQTVLGQSKAMIIWFTSKTSRDEYYNNHDYCDKLRARAIEIDRYYTNVYGSYKEYLNHPLNMIYYMGNS